MKEDRKIPDSNNDELKYSFLKEFCEGEYSEEKIEHIASWFDNPDYRFKIEHCLKELWKETNPDKVTSPTGLDVILDRIHHKINLSETGKASQKKLLQNIPVIRFNHVLKNLSRVAAILLLPLMSYLGWEVVNQKMWDKSQNEILYNEIFCPIGTRSHFELPDGTTGWLNNGSRLKYPVKFFDNYREVELIGEAYFDVTHNRSKPFIINTGGLDVKVLGTKLNVHAYPDEEMQAFTLESGSIELIRRDNEQEITVLKMKSGQHAVYTLAKDQLDVVSENSQETIIVGQQNQGTNSTINNGTTSQKIDALGGKINIGYEETSKYTDWTNGKLILRNDPMPLMLKRIERWYNVKFIVKDERINSYRYWATFEEENLDQVLRMLSLTGPIKFVKIPREQMDNGRFKPQEIEISVKK
ncbi:FecR family protein [Bacteroidota bacterium]